MLDHLSSLWKESGTGSLWSGELLRTSKSFDSPLSPLNSPGSRCLTTDFADPESFCHILGAASFFSLSFCAASNHLQLVTKLSNELGSPSHVGTSELSPGITPAQVPKVQGSR